MVRLLGPPPRGPMARRLLAMCRSYSCSAPSVPGVPSQATDLPLRKGIEQGVGEDLWGLGPDGVLLCRPGWSEVARSLLTHRKVHKSEVYHLMNDPNVSTPLHYHLDQELGQYSNWQLPRRSSGKFCLYQHLAGSK